MVKTEEIAVKTKGNCHILDITPKVQAVLSKSGIANGTVTLEKVAPQNGHYEHEKTWHDDNGHAHIRASLLGPSLAVPIVDGQLTLGTWQQIVLIDFDTRSRTRTIICQMMG
jgi:thiamine phosphate synthase YjbQ (UPF0047 family)